jgi:iron-sulfur cluster assembly protein
VVAQRIPSTVQPRRARRMTTRASAVKRSRRLMSSRYSPDLVGRIGPWGDFPSSVRMTFDRHTTGHAWSVLVLTHEAATAIRGIVEANELPEETGLRITIDEASESEAALNLSFGEAEVDDTVVAEEGAAVYLDEQAAELLEDKVLDAAVFEDRIAFAIRDQGGPPTFSSNGTSPN